MTNQVAVNSPDVQAAVPFYGRQPAPGDVPRIKASLLVHYAGDDERINAGIPEFEAALKDERTKPPTEWEGPLSSPPRAHPTNETTAAIPRRRGKLPKSNPLRNVGCWQRFTFRAVT